jgi:hypothetical protein
MKQPSSTTDAKKKSKCMFGIDTCDGIYGESGFICRECVEAGGWDKEEAARRRQMRGADNSSNSPILAVPQVAMSPTPEPNELTKAKMALRNLIIENHYQHHGHLPTVEQIDHTQNWWLTFATTPHAWDTPSSTTEPAMLNVSKLAEELVAANNDRGNTFDNSPSQEETEGIIRKHLMDTICCRNGKFGQLHDCEKQPAATPEKLSAAEWRKKHPEVWELWEDREVEKFKDECVSQAVADQYAKFVQMECYRDYWRGETEEAREKVKTLTQAVAAKDAKIAQLRAMLEDAERERWETEIALTQAVAERDARIGRLDREVMELKNENALLRKQMEGK